MKTFFLIFALSIAAFAQNECSNLTSGNTAGAPVSGSPIQMLRNYDAAGVLHDLACLMTDGTIVFPFGFTVGGPNSQHSPLFRYEFSYNTAAKGGFAFTNTNAVSRGHGFLFRSCNPGCGTDFNLFFDSTNLGNEDITLQGGTSNTLLYITGNCPAGCAPGYGTGGVGTKQFTFTDGNTAGSTNPEFGITNGHITHGIVAGVNQDNWGTAVCAASTVTVTFTRAFTTATYQVILTDQTTAGGAKAGTKNTGSFVITCTGATDSVDYLVLGNPY